MADFFRYSIYLGVTLTFLVAFGMSAGRMASSFVPYFEDEINNYLKDRGISIVDPSSKWQGFKPSFRVEEAHFDEGSAHLIEVEIDLVKSLIRNHFVASRLVVEDVRLSVDLAKERSGPLQITELLEILKNDFEFVRYGDEIDVHLSVRFYRGEEEATWQFHAHGISDINRHRFHIEMTSPTHPESHVSYRLESTDPVLWLQTNDYRMTLEISDLIVNVPLLTGRTDMPIVRLATQGEMQKVDQVGFGVLDFFLQVESEIPVTTTSQISMYQEGDESFLMHFRQPSLTTQGTTEYLSDWVISVTTEQISAATQSFNFETLMPALDSMTSKNENTNSWLRGLQPNIEMKRLELVLDEEGLHWYADIDSLSLNEHLRFPRIKAAALKAGGSTNQTLVSMNESKTSIHAPILFTHGWDLASLSGTALIHNEPHQIGISTWDMVGHMAASESLDIPTSDQFDELIQTDSERFEIRGYVQEPIDLRYRLSIQRALGGPIDFMAAISVTLEGTLLPLNQAPLFYPLAIETELEDLQREHLRSASFFNSALSLVSVTDQHNPKNIIELQLDSQFTNGTASYSPNWPIVSNASGHIHANENVAFINFDKVTTLDFEVKQLSAKFPYDGESYYSIEFDTEVETQKLLDFVQASEMKDWLTAAHPSWAGDGPVQINARLSLPYSDEKPIDSALNQIQLTFDDVNLSLADLNIELSEMVGTVEWRYPYFVEGTLQSGQFFDHDLSAQVSTETTEGYEVIDLEFLSDISYEQILQVTEMQDYEVASGTMPFDAHLLIYPGSKKDTELLASTQLEGFNIDLPQPLGKTKDQELPTYLQATFSEEHTLLAIQNSTMYTNLQFGIGESGILQQGTLTIGNDSPVSAQVKNSLVITGELESWVLDSVQLADTEIPILYQGLAIREFSIGDIPLTDSVINGFSTPDSMDIHLIAKEIEGAIQEKPDDRFYDVTVNSLRWELSPDGEDPLAVEDINTLIPAHVVIEELLLRDPGEEEYENWGSWQFTLEPVNNNLKITDFEALLHGATLKSDSPIWWDGNSNTTRAQGSMTGSDLAEVVIGLGNTPNIETESYSIEFDISWPGSPLAFDYEIIAGDFSASADSGRFVNIETGAGAMRLFGLLNISKVFNRLALDFQDIVQPGLHFDTLVMESSVDVGTVTVNQPLRIKGPGSELIFEGVIETLENAIDAELTIRFPLNKSLQAYAAYLALVNPVAGIGLFIGADRFDDQINSLVTGQYEITGDLDDPAVTLLDVTRSGNQEEP